MKTVKLGTLITISKGKKHTLSEMPSAQSVRMLGIDDLRNDTLIRMTDDKDGVLACDNDVLIAWDGANAGTIGYGKRGYIGSTISRLRLQDTSRFYAPFIGMFLQSNFSYLRKTATGATIPHINRNALASIQVPVFTYGDQIRIATLLSKVENLISRRREQLKQLDELLKSVFLEMFGLHNGEVKKWIIEPLSACTEIVSGVTKGKKYNGNKVRDVPYMRVANVKDGYLNLSEIKKIEVTEAEIHKYKLISGDLLLTEGGDPDKLGRGAVWSCEIDECIHQNHIFRVRAIDNSVNTVFLSALMASKYGKLYFFKAAKQTTGIASINSTQLKAFPLIKPPIDLQNRFAEIVEKVEGLKSCYQQSLAELEKTYASLSQKVFIGKLVLSRSKVVDDGD
jgi:type I restriction enzyme S subunit